MVACRRGRSPCKFTHSLLFPLTILADGPVPDRHGGYNRHDELMQLQDSVDRIIHEKQDIERQASEQAETLRRLAETNNTLSTRALALAEEAAAAPEKVRLEVEGQLAETRSALQKAQKEIDDMRNSDQSQRMALLEELNTLQTDNASLRAQMRAYKK